MPEKAIGVMGCERLAAGVVEENRLTGALRFLPETPGVFDPLGRMPVERICEAIRDQVLLVAGGERVSAIGVAVPGIIQNGVVGDSPNLQQLKGWHLEQLLTDMLAATAPVVHVLNDADALATGVAAARGALGTLIRVWYLGVGIGFGRYPHAPGAWEGGHSVVSLDPNEKYCGCGGIGHLEGIVGHRAMRLRFLDLEPEEVFAQSRDGDPRCDAFVKLWHRALAAASATSIHLEGPGKFFLTGPNARFVQPELLDLFVREMVKMTPLQGSLFEVIPESDEYAVLGAAVAAGLRAGA